MDLDPPRRRFREGNLALTALVILPVSFAVILVVVIGGLLGILTLLGLFP